jgi:hypothetical protein
VHVGPQDREFANTDEDSSDGNESRDDSAHEGSHDHGRACGRG